MALRADSLRSCQDLSRDDPAAAKSSSTIPPCRNYVEGGGAKKQRREPFGRRQRQNSPSGDG